MIDKVSLSSDWLFAKQAEYKKDPSLIEHPEFNFLNKKLKFVAKGAALFYWCETVKLIR